MDGLTSIDAELLKFIHKNGSADLASIKQKFPKISAIEHRLKKLSTPKYRELPNAPFVRPKIPIENSSFLIKRTGANASVVYELTEYGQQTLQDYFAAKRLHRRELWLANAWIPIIVSFVTTVITNYILPRLPRIIQWFANVFSRMSS